MDRETLLWTLERVGNVSIAIVLIIFALFSVIEALRFFGVPIPLIGRAIENREGARLRLQIDRFFDDQTNFLRQEYSILGEELLKSIGLKRTGLNKVRTLIIRLANEPVGSSEDRIETLRRMILSPPILIDTKLLSDPLYREVEFYINFIDACSDQTLGPTIGDLLGNHIRSKLKAEQLQNVTLVVPHSGNFMLGVHVGRALRRDIILMRTNPRLSRDQFWDGILEPCCDTILIHDVTVTAEQLLDAHRVLRTAGHNVLGIYSLIERTDKIDYKALSAAQLPIHSVIKLNQSELSELVTHA